MSTLTATKNITAFDRQNLKELRTALDKKLAEVAEEMGISISLGTMRFDAKKVTCRMTMETKTQKVGKLTQMPAPGAPGTKVVFNSSNVSAGMKFAQKDSIYTVYKVNPTTVYARTQRQAPTANGYRINYTQLNKMTKIA